VDDHDHVSFQTLRLIRGADEQAWQPGQARGDRGGLLHVGARLNRANLSNAKLTRANLTRARLLGANLTGADLTGADLENAVLVNTKLNNAQLCGCHIYGISVWDVALDKDTQQADLVITPKDQPAITLDNLEMAQSSTCS
jgi:hypothetical protein